jgi:pimeloyl-ACP methyl ester carboxylesterase
MPTIRLGGDGSPLHDGGEPGRTARLRTKRVTVGRVATRALSARGDGVPTVLLHGWLDNADTWLAVLDRLAVAGRPAVAYDLPGFGTAPPLGPDSVLDQLVEFAADAVEQAAEAAGSKVVVAGNSLGGWTALRLAERSDLPLAGVVPIGPAGVRMAPAFFSLDRIPAVSRVISLPAPLPPGVVRGIAGSLYRRLAFADPASVDQTVVDHFTQFHTERSVIRDRIEYAKRLRAELDDPFDAEAIKVPVTVIWGDSDRLCMPAGAAELGEMLPHADVRMVPGVGHTPQVEAPNLVVEAIVELCEGARRR